jgi:hypothetical protein
MKRSTMAVAVALVALGCGKKDQTPNVVSAMAEAAAAAPKVEAAMADAEKFQKERVAKGDTVAIPYADLQQYLPTSVDGYTADGNPSGSQQAMPGFSMSQTEQTWVAPANADGNTPEVQITLVDFGGTEQGYAMMAAPMMMTYSQEDDHQRVGSTPIDVPYTGAWIEFDKDAKDAKITAITRYRYVITVEARNQSEDQSEMVKRVAADIAKKFAGK